VVGPLTSALLQIYAESVLKKDYKCSTFGEGTGNKVDCIKRLALRAQYLAER